jgi:hypothetical protein
MRNLSKCRAFICLAFVCCTLSAFTLNNDVSGWFLAGSQPDAYEIGIENNTERKGKVAYLKSVKQPKGSGFGTIMQTFIPEDYLGKRVRLSGYIKSADVKEWAGMWFRVDGEPGKSLAFDNMQGRPIKGTTAWKRYEIVLDVPRNATAIAYGVLVAGPGSVWIDDLNFEVVNTDTPVSKGRRNKPQNSNFEEGN